MMRKILWTAVLTIGVGALGMISPAQTANPKPSATAKPAATVQKDVPAEFQAGIKEMLTAKSALEKAGDKWGGHRVQAISLIDQALKAVGQQQARTTTEMDSGPVDEPTAMQNGITALQTAKSDFENAGNQWGGRRAKALSLIDAALKELQLGIDYAKAHGTY